MSKSKEKPSEKSISSDIINKHEELKKLIREHDYNYHVLDKPMISDYAFDQLFQELLELETNNPGLGLMDSPSQRIGSQPLEAFNKVEHRTPMLSLSNSYSPEEILKFDERVKAFLKSEEPLQYYCEPKFDGLALELVYEEGLLVRALTRGDGNVGEDVTLNVKTIRTIPLVLNMKTAPKLFEVRGEALMFKEDFKELNESQEELGLQIFANPRNAAAGTIRQLDSAITASRPLKFFAYAIGVTDDLNFKSQMDLGEFFLKAGLPVVEKFKNQKLRMICNGPTEVIEFYHSIEKIRESLPFEIDGVVVKVNSLRLQDDLGLVARSPRWATAAKYKPAEARTVIESIDVQVGRTGTLTPVAVMKPVKVGGVTITNATLHNQEEIDRKDVRVGDAVIVHRAGDVIPEVVSVILSERPKNSTPFKLPNHCPVCGEKAVRFEEEVALRCVNSTCPAILKESLKHFVSRRAMNIDKVGDRLIETLVDQKLVKCFSDLYKLKSDQLLALDRQGEKSVQNVLSSIKKSQQTQLSRFIHALGIRFVGEQTAKLLAAHYGTMDEFLGSTEEELLKVPEVGPKVAKAILDWIRNPKNKKEVNELLISGVKIITVSKKQDGPFNGKSFLITGTLPVKRDEAQDWIEKNGGKILSSVSSKLDFLVVGDDPGSKLIKAQSLGLKIISWDELKKMI